MSNLKAIEVALREPFVAQDIHFKPKQPRQNSKTGRWECLALPYADKRTYEDRLNQLAYGEWSTPYTAPIVAGNKLVVPVTVVLYGVAHTDFGEAFLSSTTRHGETRQEENSATEAYSQAFRRACSQFGLGRYLYTLPKLWLPYDPKSRTIVISESERIAWVEKLYIQAGFPPRKSCSQAGTLPHPVPQNRAGSNGKLPCTPPAPPDEVSIHERQPQPAQAISTPSQLVGQQLLTWLRQQLDPVQTSKACTYYQVSDLANLTGEQAIHLTNYIFEVQNHQQEASAPANAQA